MHYALLSFLLFHLSDWFSNVYSNVFEFVFPVLLHTLQHVSLSLRTPLPTFKPLYLFPSRQVQERTGNMDMALWLTAITFLTVGYGDVSPETRCGRVVCLFTGLMVRDLRRDTQHHSGQELWVRVMVHHPSACQKWVGQGCSRQTVTRSKFMEFYRSVQPYSRKNEGFPGTMSLQFCHP